MTQPPLRFAAISSSANTEHLRTLTERQRVAMADDGLFSAGEAMHRTLMTIAGHVAAGDSTAAPSPRQSATQPPDRQLAERPVARHIWIDTGGHANEHPVS
jgi:hypothetical protein